MGSDSEFLEASQKVVARSVRNKKKTTPFRSHGTHSRLKQKIAERSAKAIFCFVLVVFRLLPGSFLFQTQLAQEVIPRVNRNISQHSLRVQETV